MPLAFSMIFLGSVALINFTVLELVPEKTKLGITSPIFLSKQVSFERYTPLNLKHLE